MSESILCMRSIQNGAVQVFQECSKCTPKSKWFSLGRVVHVHVCRWKPFLQLIVKCRDRFTRHRAEQEDHKHKSKSIHYFPCNKKPFFLHRESILIQALGFHLLDEAAYIYLWNYECYMYVTCPRPYMYRFIQVSQKYFSRNESGPRSFTGQRGHARRFSCGFNNRYTCLLH